MYLKTLLPVQKVAYAVTLYLSNRRQNGKNVKLCSKTKAAQTRAVTYF